MADTLKFGPEWLRALSDGNTSSNMVGTPPPLPGFSSKYKLAEYRYGREEMLALFDPNIEIPEDLKGRTSILVEKKQEPLALVPLSDEEQRILSQSVNSMAVLRMFGRGGPPGVRGGRGGGTIERGRGRGRGRGEAGFMQRGMSADENSGTGFGRPPSRDGWEEVGNKRNYQNRYDDPGIAGRREFNRSLSSENWRGKEDEEQLPDDGDWRRAGGSKYGGKTSWRDPSHRQGFEADKSRPNGLQRGGFDRDKGGSYQRNRNSESWDDEGENVPEWSTADADDPEEQGSFDASGAFVVSKQSSESGQGDRDSPQQKSAQDESSVNVDSRSSGGQKANVKTKEESETCNTLDKNNTKNSPKNEVSPSKQENQENFIVQAEKNVKNKEKSINNNNNQISNTQNSDLSYTNSAKVKSGAVPQKDSKQMPTAKSKDNVQAVNRTETSGQKQKSVPEKDSKKSSKREMSQAEQEALERLKENAETIVLEAMDNNGEESEKNNSSSGSTESHQQDESYHQWYYLDPQGDVQGAFTSSEMADWFSAGYFTLNLQVKRGCDQKYSPLGELIKNWREVPFLAEKSPPPLLNSPPPTQSSPDPPQQQQQQQQQQAQQQQQQQEHLNIIQQQQYLLHHQHIMQQTMLLRQIQMQQIQQIMQQMQENESFKALPAVQQQQLAMQVLLKQTHPSPLMMPQAQHPPTSKISTHSPPSELAASSASSMDPHAAFQRSISQPAELPKTQAGEDNMSIWGSVNPPLENSWSATNSVWDLDPKSSVISPADIKDHLEKVRKEKDLETKKQLEEEERRRREEIKKKEEELLRQQEEIKRQKEEMERQRQEIERQKQLELQKIEEMRQEEEQRKAELKAQQRRKAEDERKKKEEEKRQKEEEMRRKKEEEKRRQQELQRQQEELRQQELHRQELLRQQELQRRQEELQQEAEMEKQIEMQKQQEAQRQQEIQRQQQEALRKLQQEQLASKQLPSHAQWGSQQNAATAASPGQSLLEIQEQEERERLQQEQRNVETQRQQMMELQQQQQQQQQQKSWGSQLFPNQSNSMKSLLEIQEEQARQLERDQRKKQEHQQNQTKNLSLGAASVWSGTTSSSSPSSHWASEGAWGNALRAQNVPNSGGTSNASGSLGFWDDAIISSKRAPSTPTKSSNSQSKDFPALKTGSTHAVSSNPSVSNKSHKSSKSTKEEEAVKKLFQQQPNRQVDDFTSWCEKMLRNMATTVDIPTFISFLKEVDSPYEVHDYVKSYLGESKAASDFAKQFLEKRSQSRNKAKKQEQSEDSIWGPAPARDFRQPQNTEWEAAQKAKGKKKKKMMKVDNSILGFTVHADTARKNIGEIDDINK